MKIAKRVYAQKLQILENDLQGIEEFLQAASETNGENLDYPDQWNEYHDAKAEIKAEIHDLHSAYRTRNYTAGDWNSWNLVAQNID